ncbi:hypothetical protein EDEG_00293 [Edhazardia aedis USNM 41457]|uniref:Uncharacterized protein n=1 Tax=Edhazardia aedis (strain USNM 41457) TaxID=1003232 RepID=J9DIC5_EDHAE|nr:hypothetical protein EDEG_00293 [Edhazardia aedis USNM 41457]|eukprot:EJW02375.1 hypothetical protein EDEG_00293 [Edhazardia aedis USNM 41457]
MFSFKFTSEKAKLLIVTEQNPIESFLRIVCKDKDDSINLEIRKISEKYKEYIKECIDGRDQNLKKQMVCCFRKDNLKFYEIIKNEQTLEATVTTVIDKAFNVPKDEGKVLNIFEKLIYCYIKLSEFAKTVKKS